MPLKDLHIDDELGFPELGIIRLGIKDTNQNGKEFPRETPYFVMKDAQHLIADYGTEPTELLVYLPFRESERNFRVFYEHFKGSGKGNGNLYCQGDGERITWAVDPGRSGEVVVRGGKCILPYQEENSSRYEAGDIIPCSGSEGEQYYPRCAACKPRAILSVLVRNPHFPQQLAGGNKLGYYRISTGSIRNIINITQGLNTVQRLAESMGKDDLTFIPLILRRKPGNVTITMKKDNGDGHRASTTKYFLEIELDTRWLGLALQSVNPELLTAKEAAPALESGEPDFIDAPDFSDLPPLEADKIADLQAMLDTPPTSLNEARAIMAEFGGTAYDERTFFFEVKARMGVARHVGIKYPAAWPHMVDEMVDILMGL
jgi:hypothetical protein